MVTLPHDTNAIAAVVSYLEDAEGDDDPAVDLIERERG
jgi:hypothetical protein